MVTQEEEGEELPLIGSYPKWIRVDRFFKDKTTNEMSRF